MQESGSVLLYFTSHADAETVSLTDRLPAQVYLVVPEQTVMHAAVPKNGSLWAATKERHLVRADGEQ